jgi:hypothetical protein
VKSTGSVTGDSFAGVTGAGLSGITAQTSGGNGSVSVTVGPPSLPAGSTSVVQGGTFGILASSAGTGGTTVLVNAGLGLGPACVV